MKTAYLNSKCQRAQLLELGNALDAACEKLLQMLTEITEAECQANTMANLRKDNQ